MGFMGTFSVVNYADKGMSSDTHIFTPNAKMGDLNVTNGTAVCIIHTWMVKLVAHVASLAVSLYWLHLVSHQLSTANVKRRTLLYTTDWRSGSGFTKPLRLTKAGLSD